MALHVLRTSLAILAAGTALVAGPGSASETGLGAVSDVFASADGFVAFSVSGTRTAKPACATQDRWAINTTTPAGQAMAAMLMTAHTTNRQVRIDGTGTCSLVSQFETVHNIHIG